MLKRCSVLCDTPRGVLQCELELAEEATIAVALEVARVRFGEDATDWQHVASGIDGRVQARSFVPADGDRIEFYRELCLDPRAARRSRLAAKPKSGSSRGPGRD